MSIVSLKDDIRIISSAAVGGREEGRGLLGDKFDLIDESDLFNMKSYEDAEGEMSRLSLNLALNKLGMSHEELSLVAGGDLQNQCIATSNAISSLGVPFLGLYGACSTCTEAILTLSAFMSSSNGMNITAAISSSHNSAAERQFRMPLEYGGQRPPTAQWTSTAAASFILKKGAGSGIRISEFMVGRIVDGAIKDGANMGAAMSFAAFDTIKRYFSESGRSHKDFDYIVTGDLGKVGSSMLAELLSGEGIPISKHIDSGLLLYDEKTQDCHSGASGCGTSAAALSLYFLPKLLSGEIDDILFLSTGALMNPSGLLRGNTILGIAPLIHLTSKDL
jgi:stage V sporulation protein AD